MYEVEFYGRGGQGLYLASQILAHAAFLDGKFPQAFPEFTAERRGAPISAFLRIDTKPIRLRCRIYRPNGILVFDPAFLPHISEILEHVKPTGCLLINSSKDIEIARRIRLAHVDADGIAEEYGLSSTEGHHMGNMAMLGAFSRLTRTVTLASLVEAIRIKIPRMQDENIRVAQAGFERVVIQGMAPPRGGGTARIRLRVPRSLISISRESTRGRPTSTWRLADPVFTEKCTACGICSFFCPEGVIEVLGGKKMAIDLNYCKGCWICADVCPVEGALRIQEKGGAK